MTFNSKLPTAIAYGDPSEGEADAGPRYLYAADDGFQESTKETAALGPENS